MPRAANDSRNYDIAVVDSKTGQAREILSGFPSVTTVIGDTDGTGKDAMSGWGFNLGVAGVLELLERGIVKPGDTYDDVRKRMYRKSMAPWQQKDKRAEEGTNVHDVAEKLLLGTVDYDDIPDLLTAEEQGYGRSLIKWHQEFDRAKRLVVSVERTLVSLDYQYAGTCDLIDQEPDWAKDEVRIVDYKTSKAVRESHVIQGKAYAAAWEETTRKQGNPMRVREISVVRFGVDGEYEEHIEQYDNARVFHLMLALYKERNGLS